MLVAPGAEVGMPTADMMSQGGRFSDGAELVHKAHSPLSELWGGLAAPVGRALYRWSRCLQGRGTQAVGPDKQGHALLHRTSTYTSAHRPWLALGLKQQSRQEAAAVAQSQDGLTVLRSAAVRSSVWERTVATTDRMQTKTIDTRAMAKI